VGGDRADLSGDERRVSGTVLRAPIRFLFVRVERRISSGLRAGVRSSFQDVGVDHRRLDVCVAQIVLNVPNVEAIRVSGKHVSQRCSDSSSQGFGARGDPAIHSGVPTVFQDGPYRFFFYSADRNEPAHVHVEREANRAKFWLAPVRLARSGGFSAAELRQIERRVVEREELLLRAWDEYFAASE
jgi:Domain of unknown function (DUF4160)